MLWGLSRIRVDFPTVSCSFALSNIRRTILRIKGQENVPILNLEQGGATHIKESLEVGRAPALEYIRALKSLETSTNGGQVTSSLKALKELELDQPEEVSHPCKS